MEIHLSSEALAARHRARIGQINKKRHETLWIAIGIVILATIWWQVLN